MGFLRSLDPKLVSTIVATGLARAVLALGGDPVGDPLYNGLISLAVGAVIGYLWPNDGTVLRTSQESGNPDPSKLEKGAIDLMTVLIVLGIIVLVVVLISLVDVHVR